MTQLKTLIAWLYSLVGRFNRWLARSPLFAYLVLVLAIALGVSTSESYQRETLNSAISRCDQANLQRAYELANRQDGAFRYQLVLDLQPIVNCPPTIDTGHVVLVTKAVQRKYVEMVIDKRCWPKLDPDGSGEIVGCRPLPSASQMP